MGYSVKNGGSARSPSTVQRLQFKDRRLRHRSDFQRVYGLGSKVHGRFMTLFVLPNRLNCTRIGITATRKVGGAVGRNRAKRRVREIFRTTILPSGMDLVVVVRPDLITAPWPQVREEFGALLIRQGRRTGRRPWQVHGTHGP